MSSSQQKNHFRYDGLLRLTSVNATDPVGNQVQGYSYTFGDSGNIKRKVRDFTENGWVVRGKTATSRSEATLDFFLCL